MSKTEYHLPDEPSAPPWAMVTNPIWAFFSAMFIAFIFAWVWLVINAFMLGAQDRWKQLGIVMLGLAGGYLYIFTLFILLGNGVLESEKLPYALVGLIAWKLLITYYLFYIQSSTFQLFEYFGGAVKQGLYVLLIGYLLRVPQFLDTLPLFLSAPLY